MIKNYTTGVDEGKTVGEIMGLLAGKGARAIQIEYDESSRPKGISFVVNIKDGTLEIPVPFRLPCNFDGVFRAMVKQYKDYGARSRFERNPESRAQSRRVAWRIIKDWVAAQMALIEAEQATVAEVFLPYAVHELSGKTIYRTFIDQVTHQKSLTSGADEVYEAEVVS